MIKFSLRTLWQTVVFFINLFQLISKHIYSQALEELRMSRWDKSVLLSNISFLSNIIFSLSFCFNFSDSKITFLRHLSSSYQKYLENKNKKFFKLTPLRKHLSKITIFLCSRIEFSTAVTFWKFRIGRINRCFLQ